VCKFVLETGSQLICTGVENLTSITVVESLECCGGGNRRVAAGFIASDFVLWDLSHQSELMRVSCGGWRRPHSYVVGGAPEHQYCFAYLKVFLSSSTVVSFLVSFIVWPNRATGL
jgi:hypothetical protein